MSDSEREVWLELRARVQRRAEEVLGEQEAMRFLNRGKLQGRGGFAGMYVQGLLCSVAGCEHVLKLLDAIERGEEAGMLIVE